MATLVVDTLDDIVSSTDNQTSLREALAAAEADSYNPSTITFAPGLAGGVITLAAELSVWTEADLVIDGDLNDDGTPDITLDANADGDADATTALGQSGPDFQARKALWIGGFSDPATIDGLVITGGVTTADRDGGAGIDAPERFLTVKNSIVRDNATLGDDAPGGGIFNYFGITLINSAVLNNSTSGDDSAGGGTYNNYGVTVVDSVISNNSTLGARAEGGGISTFYTATVTNSIISNNSTAGDNAPGGGLYSGEILLTNTTVSGNSTSGTGSHGGGLYGDGEYEGHFDGLMSLAGSTVSGNSTSGASASGGGIFHRGELVVADSTIADNATAGEDATGGGIHAELDVTLTNSAVTGNSTEGKGAEGGGIFAATEGTYDGDTALVLISSRVADNSTAGESAAGGGISANGEVRLTGTTIEGNSTAGLFADGGGLHAHTAVLLDSTVSGNGTFGGAAYGGGLSGVTLLVDLSTIDGNRTTGDDAAGGGLYVGGTLRLTNSTVSGNSTAGVGAEGGGIAEDLMFADTALINSTVTGNSTFGAAAPGGGLMGGGWSAVLENTIIAGNVAVNADHDDAHYVAPDAASIVGSDPGLIFAETEEVLADSDGDGIGDTPTGVLAGVLADHSGPTETVALLADPSNPALDSGDAAVAPATDQRGIARPQGPGVDLGAYELSPPVDPGPEILLAADFEGGSDGFVYADDTFGPWSNPDYADGAAQDGVLSVTLGGIDDARVRNMSGGWREDITLEEVGAVSLSFRYNLTLSEAYEPHEEGQVLAALDGQLIGGGPIDTLTGADPVSTGWQEVTLELGELAAGTHTLTLGAFNTVKSAADEVTMLSLDDVLVTAEATDTLIG